MPTARTLTLCGTCTVDPLADVLAFWGEYLGQELPVQVAPYGQLFQQLLDPASMFHARETGANAVLLRWSDLLPGGAAAGGRYVARADVERCIDELVSALGTVPMGAPCLVLVGPGEQAMPVLAQATNELRARLAGVRNLRIECGDQAMQRYRVGQVADPASDRFGHVPYTPEAMVALGTTIARWWAAITRPPIKLFAVDCDNTLWSGVVAEDGVAGLAIDAPHAQLQRALAAQSEAGRLVCLLSNNEAWDVRRVFEQRKDMVLAWPQVVDHRVDWNPKPDNLRALAATLGVGLDSVVFLDDNPLECAAMRAACPAVATVRVPTEPAQLDAFVDHLWLLDPQDTTAEDRARTRMYHDHARREQLSRGSDSLQAFLDGLELVVDVAEPTEADMDRVAQLTQRTNQFNASLVRCREVDVRRDADTGGAFLRLVRARDRFGDYGIIGVVRAHRNGQRLGADLFLLSCRALGRGIEHRMVAALGEHALALGLDEVAVLFRAGDRNAPAKRFLQGVFNPPETVDGGWFLLPAPQAATLRSNASMIDSGAIGSRAVDAPASPSPGASPIALDDADRGARHEHIAHALTTAARIEQAMARRVRARPDLGATFTRPAPGVEEAIASIWQHVLRIDAVGRDDRFQDLGGTSLHLVQVHRLLLERLGVDIGITTMFQHPTVASLASWVQSRGPSAPHHLARQRGIDMRNARAARKPRASA